jgi:hypothetical protein
VSIGIPEGYNLPEFLLQPDLPRNEAAAIRDEG